MVLIKVIGGVEDDREVHILGANFVVQLGWGVKSENLEMLSTARSHRSHQ